MIAMEKMTMMIARANGGAEVADERGDDRDPLSRARDSGECWAARLHGADRGGPGQQAAGQVRSH